MQRFAASSPGPGGEKSPAVARKGEMLAGVVERFEADEPLEIGNAPEFDRPSPADGDGLPIRGECHAQGWLLKYGKP
jgi:hypothetical protein